MFEDLTKNIEQEKKIITNLRSIQENLRRDTKNSQFYGNSANHLLQQLQILNNAVPELLRAWSPIKKFAQVPAANTQTITQSKRADNTPGIPQQTVRMSYVSPSTKEKHFVTVNKKDRKNFLEKLRLSEQALSSLGGSKGKKDVTKEKKPSAYARFSNKLFSRYSENMASTFKDVERDLKKGNIPVLLTTYISMMFLSLFLSLVVGAGIYTLLFIFGILDLMFIWTILLLPLIVFIFFYVYPSGEAGSLEKRIAQELPFATIHMAAIAGSDITPIKIFKIIAESKEYKGIGEELKKIVIQVEVYGYDIVTSLKNVANRTSNKRLAELFSGIATNISTGGSLKNYLQKKAENFLLDYRLDRRKYTDLAGTFMDIYISILIAAPLVLMMMFIVMNVAGLGLGSLSLTTVLFLSIGAIVVINIIFMVVLNMKQPNV